VLEFLVKSTGETWLVPGVKEMIRPETPTANKFKEGSGPSPERLTSNKRNKMEDGG
jgi:hypothetical protein